MLYDSHPCKKFYPFSQCHCLIQSQSDLSFPLQSHFSQFSLPVSKSLGNYLASECCSSCRWEDSPSLKCRFSGVGGQTQLRKTNVGSIHMHNQQKTSNNSFYFIQPFQPIKERSLSYTNHRNLKYTSLCIQFFWGGLQPTKGADVKRIKSYRESSTWKNWPSHYG